MLINIGRREFHCTSCGDGESLSATDSAKAVLEAADVFLDEHSDCDTLEDR